MNGEKIDLFQYALNSYEDEYKDLSETWKSLDSKAQGTGTLSGIFLAAVFAWTRSIPESFDGSDRVLLTISLFLLLLTILISLFALFIREIPYPPLGDNVMEMVKDLNREGFTEEHTKNMVRDQIELWTKTNNELRTHNQQKATHVKHSQYMLVGAMLPIAIISLLSVFN